MADSYYNPRRVRNLYVPHSKTPFRLSRSKIDAFLKCPRCFYLDRRLGVGQPPGFPFNLNSAVDALLKKEFDIHRAEKTAHPLMKTYGISAVPYADDRMDEWRDALKGGVIFHHEATDFLVTGGVDDIWINDKGELHVVDYKATSKEGEVSLDAAWQIGYKRQVEIYQWLLRKNGFKVSDIAYFVYCNGDADKDAFDGKLEFDISVLPYEGSDVWVEEALLAAKQCLDSEEIPEVGEGCDFCAYRKAARDAQQEFVETKKKKPQPKLFD